VHVRAVKAAAPAGLDQGGPQAAGKPDTRGTRAAALDFARRLGWMGDDAGVVTVRPLLTASVPEGGKGESVRRGVKSMQVTIQRRLLAGKQALDVDGPGGRIDMTLDEQGRVIAASRVWRDAKPEGEVEVKPLDAAREEALREVQDREAYRLADWRFVLREDAANVKQAELRAVYEFDFVPRDREKVIDYPARRVEIAAEAGSKRP